MKQRRASRLGTAVSEIGFGAWAIGGTWGEVSESDAEAALNAALDTGVTFIDTANVYGDGRSETIIGRVLKARGGTRPFVATKTGREGTNKPDAYNKANITKSVEASLKRLQMDALDLVQLHCPHPAVYYMPEVFDILDGLKKDGKLKHYGVSVEKVEEGLKAIDFPGVASIQIIYNIFRQRPERLFFPEAQKKGAAVIVRVPLASGHADRQDEGRQQVRRRRPPHLQPRGRCLRQGRDLLRRALRCGARGGGGVAQAGAGGRHHGGLRAPLDPDGRGGDGRHPRRQEQGAGGSEFGGCRPAGALRRRDGGGEEGL